MIGAILLNLYIQKALIFITIFCLYFVYIPSAKSSFTKEQSLFKNVSYIVLCNTIYISFKNSNLLLNVISLPLLPKSINIWHQKATKNIFIKIHCISGKYRKVSSFKQNIINSLWISSCHIQFSLKIRGYFVFLKCVNYFMSPHFFTVFMPYFNHTLHNRINNYDKSLICCIQSTTCNITEKVYIIITDIKLRKIYPLTIIQIFLNYLGPLILIFITIIFLNPTVHST